MSDDRRKRPWRKLHVVVEVTVPPTNRAQEKDLVAAIRDWLPDTVALPTPYVNNRHNAAVRVKAFKPFYRAMKVIERRSRK